VLVGPVGLVQQEFSGGPAELVLGLAHRGERYRGVGGELDVVVADHGQIAGYRHPGLAQPAQQAQGQHVVGTEHGGRLLHCQALGPKAQVVVDTGHHAPGTNIEFIVAMLLRAGRLGGFDFNSRFYADDDLMVGAADPFQLFRIMHEVVSAGALAPAAGVAFMLDQCHNIEPKIPAQIRSVMNVQEATAKALLIDAGALAAAQQAGDVLAANAALMDAYDTDVRPLLAELREEAGLDPDPVAAYRGSGYGEKIVAERVGGQQAGWGV
jgi:L-rhamnose isomerase/sugar isomerase